MTRFHKVPRIAPLAAISLVALAVGAFFAYRHWEAHRDDPPELAETDLDLNDSSRSAAKVEMARGAPVARIADPADFVFPSARAPASGKGWQPVGVGHKALLGTLYHVPAGSALQFATHGNYVVGLDGEGEYLLEDARREEIPGRQGRHTLVWRVRSGTFRAKHHTGDDSEHWLEVRTATARLILHQGEMGINAREGGGGQYWLVSGTMTIRYADGRRKVVTQKGFDYL